MSLTRRPAATPRMKTDMPHIENEKMKMHDERKIKNDLSYISKYNKENTVSVNIRMSVRHDADIIHRLNELDEPKASYIKRLIREDMSRK